MMKLTLERDQARSMQRDFLPLMLKFCDMHIKDAPKRSDQQLDAILVKSIMREIRRKIDRKLLTTATRFRIELFTYEGIVFYRRLMDHPIAAEQFWLENLRTYIVDALHREIYDPKNVYAETID